MTKSIQTQFVDIEFNKRHIPIFLYSGGSGPAMLFIHGWLHSGEIWNGVMQEFSKTNQVFAIDLPGFGKSPALDKQMVNVSRYSDLLDNIISDILPDMQPIIVADSLGAIITLDLFGKMGRGTKQVVLSGCPVDGLHMPICILKLRGLLSLSLRFLQRAPRTISYRLVKLFSLATVDKQENVAPAIIRAVLNANPDTAETFVRELCNHQKLPRIANLRVRYPTTKFIVIRGEKDRIVSRKTAKLLTEALNANFVEIKGAGHTPMVENIMGYVDAIKLNART